MPNLNAGERLYYRGMKKREEKEGVLREARSELVRLELDNLTFTPQTNETHIPSH